MGGAWRDLLGAVVAFGVAAAATLAVRRLALRWGAVAQPRNDRWHSRPTPLLGGIGIFAGSLAGWLWFRPHIAGGTAVLVAAGGLFVVGLVDDLLSLRPNLKLGLQLLAAAGVVSAGLTLPWTPFALSNDLLTIFWLVGVTNAVNLLDNMDGLAAGIVTLACFFQILFFWQNHQAEPALLAAILMGAVAAFLRFNFSPATIFMGDCGSLFLGFLLASTVLFSSWQRSRGMIAVLLVPVLIMVVPILDTTLVTVLRLGHGRGVSQGGRDHTSHRLVALGLSERNAVLVLMGLACVGGGMAVLLHYLQVEVLYFLVPSFAVAILFFAIRLGMVAVYGKDQPVLAKVALWVDFSYRKRILEVLLDLVLMALAYFGAFLLRFGGHLPAIQLRMFDRYAPLMLVLEAVVLLVTGAYDVMWRSIGMEDLFLLSRSAIAAAMVAGGMTLLLQLDPRLSISVLILNGLLLLLFIVSSRAALRMVSLWLRRHGESQPAAHCLIWRADLDGELLARRLAPRTDIKVCGFLDDDPRKNGRRLLGLRVYAPAELARVARDLKISQLLLNVPQPPSDIPIPAGVELVRPGLDSPCRSNQYAVHA